MISRPPRVRNKRRRRVGRGIGGKGGKTAGRGTKGQHARNKVKPGFEGGQLPLTQRIPKLRGFANPFRVEYNVVNLDVLEELERDEITPESAARPAGIVHHKGLVKVLGRGELTGPYRRGARLLRVGRGRHRGRGRARDRRPAPLTATGGRRCGETRSPTASGLGGVDGVPATARSFRARYEERS